MRQSHAAGTPLDLNYRNPSWILWEIIVVAEDAGTLFYLIDSPQRE